MFIKISIKPFIITLLILINLNTIFSQGFLRVDGINIINDVDQNFMLKGICLGGWLVQEGYILHSGKLDAEHQIRNGVQELVGVEKAEELYDLYHKNYVRKIDIDSLAAWGFNSIRLPMHYNKLISQISPVVFDEDGFKTIDTLLTWCKDNEVYLILDLHATPGGQNNGGISDYNPSKPSLWESEDNKTATVELWKALAQRYVDEEWIGGYDLINETAWDLGTNNIPLMELYQRITQAIREVDNNHIIFIEGNWYATAFDGLTPPWDDNLVYSFHKYWNETDKGTINYLISMRNTYKRPLWLGETGENSNDWFSECVELMDENNIGWAWWPHKKIESISSPLSVPKVDGYQNIINYWNGSGSKPSVELAYTVLKNQFNALKFENCKVQREVYKSILQPKLKKPYPYKNHQIPGIIYGSDYDIGGQLIGYMDSEYKNIGSGYYNQGWSYRNGGVDIENCSDSKTNGYNIGWINSGEWLKFTVNIIDSGNYNFNFRFASTDDKGKFMLDLDNQNVIGLTDIPNTGNWQKWQTISVENILLPKGTHTFNLRFFFSGFNFNYFEVLPSATGITEDEDLSNEFKLFQNYPNPFNPTTTIKYSIPYIASDLSLNKVTLTVFDILGNKIETLVDKQQKAGNYEIKFNAANIASGVYYYKIKYGDYVKSQKMILMK